MNVYKYNDYTDYVKCQQDANIRKKNSHWVQEKDIELLVDYMNKNNIDNKKILCHGTRAGYEQKFFKNHVVNLEYILGTEISETATEFEDTIQHDFHIMKDEWENYFDIIYTNSWDHSYDPNKSLDVWINCIKINGYLFIEWNKNNLKNSKSDPFSSTMEVYKEIFNKKNNIELKNILEVDSKQSIKPFSKIKVAKDIKKYYFVLKRIS